MVCNQNYCPEVPPVPTAGVLRGAELRQLDSGLLLRSMCESRGQGEKAVKGVIMDEMSYQATYLEAARMIAEGEQMFSCEAVYKAARYRGLDRYLRPKLRAFNHAFSNNRGPYEFCKIVEACDDPQNIRVLMLCLMAWAWRDLE